MTQLGIRWLTRQPAKPTPAEVREVQNEYGVGSLLALKALVRARGGKTRVLQIMSDETIGWVDVPEETEELPNVPVSEDTLTAAVYKEMHL